jgi:hypothetical protein
MQTQAYFKDIQFQIIKELEKAKSTIIIAVAWFTDTELFRVLCSKANERKKVELIILDDEINNNSGINVSKLHDSVKLSISLETLKNTNVLKILSAN